MGIYLSGRLLYFLSFLSNELDSITKCEVLTASLKHQGLCLKSHRDSALHRYPKRVSGAVIWRFQENH